MTLCSIAGVAAWDRLATVHLEQQACKTQGWRTMALHHGLQCDDARCAALLQDPQCFSSSSAAGQRRFMSVIETLTCA